MYWDSEKPDFIGVIDFYQQLVKINYTDRVCRQKMLDSPSRGIHEGRLIGGGARNQEPDGDTRRRDSDLDRFGPSDRRNTLRPVSSVYCIDL